MNSAELITELQAARPVANSALRDRVRAIAAPPQAARRPGPFAHFSLRRFALVAVPAAAVLLLAVAGVAGLLDSSSPPQSIAVGRDELRQAKPGSPRELTPQTKVGTTNGAVLSGAAAADAATPAPTSGRAVRYSAQLTLAVKNLDALSDATQQALRITRDLGGYLVTASYATSDTGVSSLTVKVPTARVQDAIAELSGLGKIVAQQVQIDDLQGQVDELTQRENMLRERIARLSARLSTTTLNAETRATLEARRDAARSELARIRTATAQVNAEAHYATIQLSLQTQQSALVPAVPSRWDRALDRAGEILAVEASAVLYALVVLGPIALVALAWWLVRRGLRRRQDEQLLSAP